MRLFLWSLGWFPPQDYSICADKAASYVFFACFLFKKERSNLYHSLSSSFLAVALPTAMNPLMFLTLDLFATTLVKSESVLPRSDYFYSLAVSILGCNLASSFWRCECGSRAMNHRLSGMADSTVCDVYEVATRVLCGKSGSKDKLVTSLLDTYVCLDPSTALSRHETSVQVHWSCACDVINEELGI